MVALNSLIRALFSSIAVALSAAHEHCQQCQQHMSTSYMLLLLLLLYQYCLSAVEQHLSHKFNSKCVDKHTCTLTRSAAEGI